MPAPKWLPGFLSRLFGRIRPSEAPDTAFPLDQSLADQVTHHFDPSRNLADLIVQKLAAQGVRVSKRDRRRIEESLRTEEGDERSLHLRSWKPWGRRSAKAGEVTKMVERVERARTANAVSRGDLLRILSEMGRGTPSRGVGVRDPDCECPVLLCEPAAMRR